MISSFSAALLGQPRSFSDEDITCEYPQDVDDENVTEEGFQPTLSGETTRLSSALALFRGARILSGVLDQIYPAAVSHHLPVHTIAALSEELDTWLTGLPLHLRLQFAHDKPSTKVVGSRSPFLVGFLRERHTQELMITVPCLSLHSNANTSTLSRL